MKTRILTLLLFIMLAAGSAAHAEADTVKAGAYVVSVHDINFRDKEYTMRFWLWFLYKNPDFNFSTQLDIPNAKQIDPPQILSDSMDGKAWVIMKMKETMKENWNVHDFPFDVQHLHLQVENTLFDKNSLVFLPDFAGSKYDSGDAIDGWNIRNFKVSASTNDYETGFGDHKQKIEYFSTFNIDMDIERDAWGLYMKIFIGMYIAFLIAAISFTPNPAELEPRFGLPVGGLFAAVGNKYIIDSLLPESSSFTLVDTLHTITFLGIFSTLVVSAICLKLSERGKVQQSVRFNAIASRTVVITYVVLNIIFVTLALW